jgi:hypothetical protein
MTKTLKAVLERAASWPEWAQDDLARLALEIDQEVSAGTYRATREELGLTRRLLPSGAAKLPARTRSRQCSPSTGHEASSVAIGA